MRIEKLEIKGFGKLKDRTFTFGEGLNVVFGENESGKTSVQWFIKAMLYGLKGGKASREGIPPPLKKYRPWAAEDFNGFMEYSLEQGNRFRVERNFQANTTRIYDALFNDITAGFDISKEKGVAFAEKQLGLNEACFDRTVFIRQMESRLDEDGSRELLNKLTNTQQTGFEDISFKKAQEALKDALKSYVGTDKTTTRPLDKVLGRLEELKAQRRDALKKRDSMFQLEEELQQALTARLNLDKKLSVFSKLQDYLGIKMNILNGRKLKRKLEETVEAILKDQEELQTVQRKMEDFHQISQELMQFSAFDNEDIDKLEQDYHKLLGKKEEEAGLMQEIIRKQESLRKLEEWMSPRKAFCDMPENIEDQAAELMVKLEQLRKENGNQDGALQNEKIIHSLAKARLFKGVALIFTILTAVAGFLAFHEHTLGIPSVIGMGAFTLVFATLALQEGNKRKGLKDGQTLLFIQANTQKDELNQVENRLQQLYRSVGVTSYEGFLKLKSEYSHYAQQAESLQSDIRRMEGVVLSNSSRISELSDSISQRLSASGLVLGETFEINDKGLRDFKYGVRRYLGMKPSINYSIQRKEDLEASLQNYFKNASAFSGSDCTDMEALQLRIKELETANLAMEECCNACYKDIVALHQQEDFPSTYFSDFSEAYIESHLNEITALLEKESSTLGENLKEIQLHLRELETRLEGLASEGEELQRMDEEAAVLEQRRNKLEDMNISLKTALDVLTEASLEIQRDFAPSLNMKMSNLIQKISGGRYKDLRADDKLGLKTVAPETGDVVQALLLSGGTIDQMYLALRIGMSEMLTQGKESLPLLMDEVFAQYDDERTRETFRLLHEISRERQILFFTCKSREVEIAREVLGVKAHVITL